MDGSIQYLEDKGLTIDTKNEAKDEEKIKGPPKLKKKQRPNIEFLASGSLLRLTPERSEFPNASYNESTDMSYLDQCYETQSKLGEGSFGYVLKVEDDNGNLYAMKVSKEVFQSEADRQHRLQEVEYHSRFSYHPNVVSLIEGWEESRRYYLKMELCNELNTSRAMQENECWNVLIDMLSALDMMHRNGLGHFDVKLENILQGFDGIYRLTDFGLAFNYAQGVVRTGDRPSLPRRAPLEGDARYLAQELLQSEANFSDKADVFSLAISILELAGNLNLPPNGPVWKALRRGIFPREQTRHLSYGLFRLLRSMMDPDPSRRPSTAQILEMPLVRHQVARRYGLNPNFWTFKVPHHLLPFIAVFIVLEVLIRQIYQWIYLFQPNGSRDNSHEIQELLPPVDPFASPVGRPFDFPSRASSSDDDIIWLDTSYSNMSDRSPQISVSSLSSELISFHFPPSPSPTPSVVSVSSGNHGPLSPPVSDLSSAISIYDENPEPVPLQVNQVDSVTSPNNALHPNSLGNQLPRFHPRNALPTSTPFPPPPQRPRQGGQKLFDFSKSASPTSPISSCSYTTRTVNEYGRSSEGSSDSNSSMLDPSQWTKEFYSSSMRKQALVEQEERRQRIEMSKRKLFRGDDSSSTSGGSCNTKSPDEKKPKRDHDDDNNDFGRSFAKI